MQTQQLRESLHEEQEARGAAESLEKVARQAAARLREELLTERAARAAEASTQTIERSRARAELVQAEAAHGTTKQALATASKETERHGEDNRQLVSDLATANRLLEELRLSLALQTHAQPHPNAEASPPGRSPSAETREQPCAPALRAAIIVDTSGTSKTYVTATQARLGAVLVEEAFRQAAGAETAATHEWDGTIQSLTSILTSIEEVRLPAISSAPQLPATPSSPHNGVSACSRPTR